MIAFAINVFVLGLFYDTHALHAWHKMTTVAKNNIAAKLNQHDRPRSL